MISILLAPLVGRWATTITMLHPAAEAGKTWHAVDTYRWLPGEKVLVHDVQANMGEAMASMEVYTQDVAGKIVSRNFDGQGQVSDYEASMAAGQWRVTGERERFASTSIGADRIEGLWQLKEGHDWVDWMRVRLDRVA